MPREDQHQQKAERNEEFAASLDTANPTHENWAVVASFYAALHYVQTYFARKGIEAASHDERFEQIKRDVKLRHALVCYKYLNTLSRTARYYCTGLPASAYTKEAKPNLAAVKTQVQHALRN